MGEDIETPEAMAYRIAESAREQLSGLTWRAPGWTKTTDGVAAEAIRERDKQIGRRMLAIFASDDTDNPGDIEARLRALANELAGAK